MGKMSESMTKKGRNQNIQVFVRLRPINSREKEIKSCSVVETCGNREVVIRQTPLDCKQTKKFTFDRVFGPSSTQLEVYKNVVSPLIEEVLSGYSCTVFAYGQTGTGKTFTMAGAPATTHDKLSTSGGPSWRSDPLTGIIPRALNQLFDELRLAQMEFTIRVSYLELYNEELFDLLAPTIEQSSSKIRIYDDPTKKGSVIVQGLEEIPVQSKGEVYKILEDGQEKRKTASTLMNAQSSRSHTVFSILVHIKETNMQGEAMLKTGKLNLVDLAGSENISKAGNDKKERARETVNINQSLLTLGRVISALVDRTPHIPYRESKLTRLLQDSLGGRTKTSIIATISPGHKDLDETMSTLDYAHRAKNIMNKPEINQKLTQKLAIKGYTDEIDRLRKELYSQREKSGVFLPNEKYEDMILKLNHQDQEIADNLQKLRAIEEERNKIMAIYENSRCTLRATKSKLNATKNTLDEVQKKYKETKKVLKKTENVAEEKSHIIEVQANTEKLLSSQALDLINVAEITTVETEKLQNVLEQRRKIDHMIKSSAELFNDRMKQSIGSIKNSVQQCYEDCNNKNYLVNSNIAKLYHANIEAYNDSTETTNETFSYIQSILEMLNKLALSSNSKMSDGLRSSFECNSNKIEEARLDITRNSTDVFRLLVEEMNEIFGKRTGLVSSIYENMKSEVSKNKELIDNYVSKEQPIEIKETFEEMFSFMEKLNGKIEDQHASESLSKFLEEYKPRVASLLKQKQENSEQMSSLYLSNYDSCCEYMKKFTNNATDLNDQQKKIMENVAKEVNRVVEKVDSVLTSVWESNSAVHKDLANVVNISRKDHSSQYDTCRDVLERKLTDHVILLKAQSDMVGQHTEDFLLRNEELSKMIRELSKLVDSSLDDIVSDIGKYCSEELEVYRPTGETPVRKTHSFSKVLASTSPHERILQRFRQERGYILHQESWDNNSIIEIDESDEEDETTMVSINIPDGVEPLEHKLTSKWPSETDISKPLREEISPTRFKLTKSASAIEFRESDAHERVGKENVPVERPKSATKYDRHLSSIPVQRRDPARVLNMKNK